MALLRHKDDSINKLNVPIHPFLTTFTYAPFMQLDFPAGSKLLDFNAARYTPDEMDVECLEGQ